MNNEKQGKWSREEWSDERITKEFVRIYYGILNTHPDQLFHFYDDNSTVAVSEFGTGSLGFSDVATSRESIKRLLKNVFSGIAAKIKTAIPQGTVDGGLLLLVSGTMTRTESSSTDGEEHYFTQALVLAPQKGGFYVLNDTVHILGGRNTPQCNLANGDVNQPNPSGRFYPVIGSGGLSIGPTTPRPSASAMGGTQRSISTYSYSESGLKSGTDSDDTPRQKNPTPRPQRYPQFQQPHYVLQQQLLPVSQPRGEELRTKTKGKPLRVTVGIPPPQPSPIPIKPPVSNSDKNMPPVPPGHGVFIARLPFGIHAEEVERAFSEFGPIRNGADGIQVRDGRNGCYAFVTFEDPESAQEAIEKGATVLGKRVYVESRQPRQDTSEPAYTTTPSANIAAPNTLRIAPPPPPPPGPPPHLPAMTTPH